MRAGDLRYKIEIQEKSVERDSLGAEAITWVTFARVWADVKFNVGSKPEMDGQPRASVPAQFKIRFMDGIKTEMRVVFDGKTFDITSANPLGWREALLIDASATVE